MTRLHIPSILLAGLVAFRMTASAADPSAPPKISSLPSNGSGTRGCRPSFMRYIANYLMDPAEFEKDPGMRKSLAQLRRSFSKYRDRTEREVYHTLSAVRLVIEVQPIR